MSKTAQLSFINLKQKLPIEDTVLDFTMYQLKIIQIKDGYMENYRLVVKYRMLCFKNRMDIFKNRMPCCQIQDITILNLYL